MGYPVTYTFQDNDLNEILKQKKATLNSDELRRYIEKLVHQDLYETVEE